MKKNPKLLISAFAIAIGLAGVCPQAAAAAPVPAVKTSAAAAVRCRMFGGGPSAMELLSELSGKSVADIAALYPQKTAWQAAKSMGRLDDLKKSYLARARVFIDKLIDDKAVSAQDGAKMFSDVQKRVGAIDGVNIVITGKPGFKPQFQYHR